MKQPELGSNIIDEYELDEQQHSEHSMEETSQVTGGKQMESHGNQVWKLVELVQEFLV